MGYAFAYQGTSGETYDFLLFEIDNTKAIPWQSGIVIFASYAPEPLFIGEGESIYGLLTQSALWAFAKEKQGANQAYLRIIPDERTRRAVLADLVEHYRPPMNAAFP